MDWVVLANTPAIYPGEFIKMACFRIRQKSEKGLKLKVLHNLIYKERPRVLLPKRAKTQRGIYLMYLEVCSPLKPPYFEQTVPINISMLRHEDYELVVYLREVLAVWNM